jgi:multiple sugar transport system substrate-binding protein
MMKRLNAVLGALICGLSLAGSGSASAAQVRYMLWDSDQLPAYRQCAADFTKANPSITIKFSQVGWGDYWTSVSTGFIAGVAPDVFTNHLTKSPQFVRNDLLVDLMPYIRRDKVDLDLFPRGLVEAWGRDGRQYGLPKDWDTVGLIVNMARARKAGISLAELQRMDWNPRDGGSFERIVRRLTVDEAGRNASEPLFDKGRVAMYGYQNPGAGGMSGQIEWSHFAASNGFQFQDRPWSIPYHYDDPRLAETLTWLAGLPAKGLSASYQNALSTGSSSMFVSGRVAMVPDGAWMVRYYARNAKFESAWVPLPTGPQGHRASMFNGLADSIWVGSKVKEEAWQWVKYLASPACQRVVASDGVVLPALRGMAEQAIETRRRKLGIDSSAFLTMASDKTVLMPLGDDGAEIDELIKGAVEAVLLGRADARKALKAANDKANALLKKSAAR